MQTNESSCESLCRSELATYVLCVLSLCVCGSLCDLTPLLPVCARACIVGSCVCGLQLSCASDMWLIRCHQCVFEMGCFIHSLSIAYIFNSSPGWRQRRRAQWEGVKEKVWKEWYESDRRRVGGEVGGRQCGNGGEKLNVHSQLIIQRISITECRICLNMWTAQQRHVYYST